MKDMERAIIFLKYGFYYRTRYKLAQSLNTSNQSDEMLESQNNESDLVPIEESRPIFAQHIGKYIKSVI